MFWNLRNLISIKNTKNYFVVENLNTTSLYCQKKKIQIIIYNNYLGI